MSVMIKRMNNRMTTIRGNLTVVILFIQGNGEELCENCS